MKNVLQMNKIYYFGVIALFLVSCISNPTMVLLNKSNIIKVNYPKNIDIRYNGFKVGRDKLLNKHGDYSIVLTKELESNCNSNYFLVNDDVLGLSFYINMTNPSFMKENRPKKNNIDTCFYFIGNSSVGNKKMDNFLNGLKSIVDTLIVNKERATSK